MFEGADNSWLMKKASCCADVKDAFTKLPDYVNKLYSLAEIKNMNDAFVFIAHVLMLEVDFIPKDVIPDERYECFPSKWLENGVYKIQYSHMTCPEVLCQMTCVPLGDFIAVHGTILNKDSCDTISIILPVREYISDFHNFTIHCNSDSRIPFRNLTDLSQRFKDSFAFALLVEIQYAYGIEPIFGLTGLPIDLKFYILSCLPVKSLVAMSSVSKEFRDITNSSFLWKQLYVRDFPDELPSSTSEDHKWRELYIKEYKRKERESFLQKRRVLSCSWQPNRYQPRWEPCRRPFINDDDDRDFDFRTGLAPEVQQAFPHLARRYQTNNPVLQNIIRHRQFMNRYFAL